MYNKSFRRRLSVLIALFVTLSVIAFPAMADGVASIQSRIDLLLDSFSISNAMTDDEIAAAIASADGTTIEAAIVEMEAIDADAATQLSEDEYPLLDVTLYERFRNVFDSLFTPSPAIAVTNISGIDVTVDSNGSISESGGEVTVTASGTFTSAKTATVTVTNTSGSTATISFDYSANKVSSCSLGSVSNYKCSGTKTEVLTAGSSITFTIKTRTWSAGNTTATIVLSNFSVVAAASSSNVTFEYSGGSITVDGSAPTTNPMDISSSGATLMATPSSGYSFLGWVDGNYMILSQSASYKLTPTGDMTVIAAFASSTSKAWFIVDNKYLVDNLNTATSLGTNIVLAASGVLPAQKDSNGNDIAIDYTIPAGDKLLIPYDANHSANFGDPSTVYQKRDATEAERVAFRTLKIGGDVSISCIGSICVNAQQVADVHNTGYVYKGFGCIDIAEGGSIVLNTATINNTTYTGTLYAYGYIKGNGTVEVNAGTTIHELLELPGWRGGNVSSKMIKGGDYETDSMCFVDYYAQNVLCTLKVHSSGNAIVHGAIGPAGLLGFIGAEAQPFSTAFIGSDTALFLLSDNAIVTRKHIGGSESNRMEYTLEQGTLTTGAMEMYIKDIDSTISSADYIFPINNALSLRIKKDATFNITSDIKLVPESEMIVESGGNCEISGRLFVYDYSDWGNYAMTASGSSDTVAKFAPSKIPTSLGVSGTRTFDSDARLEVNGNLTVTDNGALYTSNTGASVTGTGAITINAATLSTTTIKESKNRSGSSGNYYPELEQVTMYPAKSILSGVSPNSTSSFTTGTYYGTENDGWYNYLVTAEYTDDSDEDGQGVGAADVVTVDAPANCTVSPVHRYGEEKPIINVVGYLSKYWNGSENATSSLTFTVDSNAASSVSATKVSDGDKVTLTGAYTLPFVESDVKLVLSTDNKYINIAGSSLKAGDTLDLYFYVAVDDLVEGVEYTAKIQRSKEGQLSETVKDIPSSQWIPDGKYLRFAYDGIAAKEMTDEVTVTIYQGDTQVSNACTESVENYAVRTLAIYADAEDNTKNAALRTTLVDMLNYGAACQKYLNNGNGYNLDKMANARIDQYQVFASEDPECTETYLGDSTYLAGANLTAESALTFRFYFNPGAVAGKSAVVSYVTHGGTNVEGNVAFVSKDGYQCVEVTGLAIADGRQDVVCKILQGDEVITTATGGIHRYAGTVVQSHANKPNDPDYDPYLPLMLMRFVDSAHHYFHFGEGEG